MADEKNKPDNSFPENSRSEDFSNMMEDYSRSLDHSADSLKSAAKDFKSSADSIKKSTDDNTDRLIRALQNFAKSFGKEMEEVENKRSKDTKSEFEKNLEDYKKENKENNKRQKAVANALYVTASTLLNAFTRNFERGFRSVLSNYNAKYTEITSRMSLSNKEYTDMLYKSTQDIRKNSLTNQFSQIDFTNQLTEVLSSGIRNIEGTQKESLATDMAWQNMITHQVLPMISTNTRTYVKYSKLLGKDFSESIRAFGTEIQKQFGAEGLEQGTADEIINELMPAITSGASNEQEASQMMGEVMSALGNVANQYDANVMQDTLAALKTAVDHPESMTTAMREAMAEAGIDYGGNNLNSENAVKFINSYINNASKWSNGVGAGAFGDVGTGYSSEFIRAVNNARDFSDTSEIKAISTDVSSTNKEIMSDLQNGFTRSITEQQDKWNENLMSGLADTAGQYFPHFDEILTDIKRIASAWFKVWLVKGTISDIKGILGIGSKEGAGSLLSKLGSGGGSSIMGSTLSGQVSQATSGGLSMSNLGSALSSGGAGAGGSLSGLGTALGVGGIAAGTVWGIVNAVQAGSRASENNMSTGQVIGQGARGFFTGSSTAGMTSDQKKAYYEQNGYFNFKDAALNAGKWALVGGGAGTLAGGPLGTAIGAVAGGIVGFAANAIDQAVDASRYKALAEASEEASNQLSNLKRSSEEYNNTIKKDVSVTKALSIAKGEIKVSESEQADALNTLQEYYPGYTKNVKEITSLTDDQIKAMQLQLDLERLKSEKDMKDTAESMYIDASAYQKGKGMGDSASIEAAQLLSKDPNRYVNNVDTLITDVSKRTGIDRNEVQSNLINSELIGVSGNGKIKKIYSLDSSYYEDYLIETQENRQAFVENEFAKVEEELSNLITTYSNAKAQGDDELAGSRATLKKLYEDLYIDVNEYGNQAVHADYVLWKTLGSQYSSELEEIQKFVGSTNAIPYRTGINKVLKDSVPATLHLGEAVLSPAVAGKARELSEGGISGFINSLYSFMSTQVTAVGQTSDKVDNPILEAITYQTDTLSSLLDLILQDTTAIARKLTGSSGSQSQVDERLRNFNRSAV